MPCFLHAADLHLGSPLAAFSPCRAAARRERQFEALERLFSEGVAAGAQMILLAGDVFDVPAPDENDAARFFAICRAQPVPVIVAPGNHDYIQECGVWKRGDLPKNLYVFDQPELSCLDFPALGVAVYGYAFTSPTKQAPFLGTKQDLLPGRTSVLLAHADLSAPLSPYAPLSIQQIERSGFHYVALGHIHKVADPLRFASATVAYSGFFAGRGFDEVGAGGAWLVRIGEASVELDRLQSTADRFEIAELDCSGAQNNEDAYECIRRYLEKQRFLPETALRLRLVGSVGLHCRLELGRLTTLGEELALFELQDETLPIFDSAYLEKDPTLRGAFYRALLPKLNAADSHTRETAAEALRIGFSALAGKEV